MREFASCEEYSQVKSLRKPMDLEWADTDDQARRSHQSGQVMRPERCDAKNLPGFLMLVKGAVTVMMHPFEYAKTLMRLGYEPLPPLSERTLFRLPILRLPGGFTYLGHILQVDGFFGLYRGLSPNIMNRFVHDSVFVILTDALPARSTFEEDSAVESKRRKFIRFIKNTTQEAMIYLVAIAASHPFQVVTNRMMAQFIGHESKYRSISGSIRDIFNEEGLGGLWSGVAPRIYGELSRIWVAATTAFLINTYLAEDLQIQRCVASAAGFVATGLTYPFTVISTVISVNGAPIAAGKPPFVPVYSSWTQCYAHLKQLRQLKRGSTLFWRRDIGQLETSPLIEVNKHTTIGTHFEKIK